MTIGDAVAAQPSLWTGILLSSSVVAALVSGLVSVIVTRIADERRNRREDAGVRRRIRAAAHALAIRVQMAHQYGLTNMTSLESSLAYLDDIAKDRAVDTALNDKASAALHSAIDLCKTFVAFSRKQGIDPESTPEDFNLATVVSNQDKFSRCAKQTFDKLREYFTEDGSGAIVAEFDRAEDWRHEILLNRIVHGNYDFGSRTSGVHSKNE